MTAEQQLERSVLEGKERDELHAIAQAMSLKTTSRTKKADIIDQILTATGVTPEGNGDAAAGSRNGSGTNGSSRSRTAPAEAASRRPAEAAPAGARPPPRRPPPPRRHRPLGPDRSAGPAGRPQPGRRPRQQQSQRQQHNQPGNVEAGNRRGRRRRGRERTPGGELQGGGNQEAAYQGELVEVRGLLDLRDEGYGFLRCEGYLPRPRTSTSRSARRGGSLSARATTSRAPAGRPATTRSTRPCCGSTPSRRSTPRRPATAHASRT